MTKFNFEIIDRIETTQLLDWAKKQPLSPEQFNGKPTKRLEHWWGKGVELCNYGKSWKVFDAGKIVDVPLLEQLKTRYHPEANS